MYALQEGVSTAGSMVAFVRRSVVGHNLLARSGLVAVDNAVVDGIEVADTGSYMSGAPAVGSGSMEVQSLAVEQLEAVVGRAVCDTFHVEAGVRQDAREGNECREYDCTATAISKNPL